MQQAATFPFQTTVNESIRQLGEVPFAPGSTVTVRRALPNGQFIHVDGHKLALHIDRFNLTRSQLALVKSCARNPES